MLPACGRELNGHSHNAVSQKHYPNDLKFSDRQVWANSVDPDQTAPLSAIPSVFLYVFLYTLFYGKVTLLKFMSDYSKCCGYQIFLQYSPDSAQ